jgi:hypothetical protein
MPPRKRHQAFRQLRVTPFERCRIVGFKEASCSYKQISRIVNLSMSIIVPYWQAWLVENRDSRAQGSGNLDILDLDEPTTDRQDWHFGFLAFRAISHWDAMEAPPALSPEITHKDI